jgi:hypothetical protein
MVAIGTARKVKTRSSIDFEAGLQDFDLSLSGLDGTRTRDLRRDRAAF